MTKASQAVTRLELMPPKSNSSNFNGLGKVLYEVRK